MSQLVVTSKKFDVVGHLAIEIIQQILFPLSSADLRAATKCCSRWKAAVECDYFWRKLCQREGYLEEEEYAKSEFYANFLTRYNYWQGVYWYNYTLQRNWETGNYKMITYELQEDRYSWDYLFFDNVLACINYDCTKLHVYNWTSKEFKPIVCTMRDNGRFFHSCILKNGNYLIHFDTEESLTVWNLETGLKVVDELWNHVTEIHVEKNLIVLESLNHHKFELLNIDTGQIEYESSGIFSNLDIMSGKIVFSKTDDDVFHILKCDDKSIITLRCCDTANVQKLMVTNELLLSFCEKQSNFETNLCLWNTTTKAKLHSIRLGGSYEIDEAVFINGYLYLKNYPDPDIPEIEFWDYMKGTIEFIFNPVTEINVCSQMNMWNDYVMVGRGPSKTEVWSFKTKEYLCDNFNIPNNYRKLRITKTKLAYYTMRSPSEGGIYSRFLHIRDFELDI